MLNILINLTSAVDAQIKIKLKHISKVTYVVWGKTALSAWKYTQA